MAEDKTTKCEQLKKNEDGSIVLDLGYRKTGMDGPNVDPKTGKKERLPVWDGQLTLVVPKDLVATMLEKAAGGWLITAQGQMRKHPEQVKAVKDRVTWTMADHMGSGTRESDAIKNLRAKIEGTREMLADKDITEEKAKIRIKGLTNELKKLLKS